MPSSAGETLFQTRTAKPETPPEAKPLEAPKRAQVEQPRTDRYGDPLPDGAIARLGTVRWRHGVFVHALAYSPDGKQIATIGVGRPLVLWDAVTGKEIRSFPGRAQPRGVAFSPDGKSIATTQRLGQIWDISTGKMRELKNAQAGVFALAFAPDGKTLATANSDGAIRLWNFANGEESRRIDCGQGNVYALAYSPHGATLASGGSDGTIHLWDANTGKERRRFAAAQKEIYSVVFTPDGKQLAVGGSNEAPRLWDVATGRLVRTYGEKVVESSPLVFSPDGKTLAAGYPDGTVSLWDAAGGKEKSHWSTGWLWSHALAFSPDGKTLASATLWDGGLRFWDVDTGREKHGDEGHRGPATLLRFAEDTKTLISGGLDHRVVWWNLAEQTPRREFTWKTDGVFGFDLSPDGNKLAISDRKTFEIAIWDIRTNRVEKWPSKDTVRVRSVVFSPDGRFVASCANDAGVRVWNVRERKEIWHLKEEAKGGNILYAPNGKTLASGMPLRLWDAADGEKRSNFDSQAGQEIPVAFSPNGKVLASVNDPPRRDEKTFVRLWDTATGKELSQFHSPRNTVSMANAAFSPDGKLVVSGGSGDEDNPIHVWEAATGRLIRSFEGHHSWVFAVAFAADGLTVASSAGDSTILIWDITGRQRDGKLSPLKLSRKQQEACWAALVNEDAAKAYDAVWSLVASGEQAVPFLRKHLPPAPRPDPQAVSRWIADLDSDTFTVRQQATEELAKLGDAITAPLQKALADKPTLEMRRRLQQLLDHSREWTPERLRVHRAIQALEHINTRSAREVLQVLAEGAAETQRTEDAKAALRRTTR